MLDLFVFMMGVLLFAAIAAGMLRAERKERCGYCSNGTDPNNICESCWKERELG